jgi:phosphoenolpyruvate carboxylase
VTDMTVDDGDKLELILESILGRVLKKHARKRILVLVERLRQGFTALREQEDEELRSKLLNQIDSLDAETLSDVIRAFTLYFGLVNIADEVAGHQKRRTQVIRGGPLWRGSFDDALRQLKERGIGLQQLQQLLGQLNYMPVFTAHPTEAKRRSVLNGLRQLFLMVNRLQSTKLSQEESEELSNAIEAQVQILWKTDEVRMHKPQVLDEVNQGLYFFQNSLFDAVPKVYRNLKKSVRRVYGPDGVRFLDGG